MGYGTTTLRFWARKRASSSCARLWYVSLESRAAYRGPVSARTIPSILEEMPVVVDANVRAAASSLRRGDGEEPLRPVDVFLAKILQQDPPTDQLRLGFL